jgi:hypothetical protein
MGNRWITGLMVLGLLLGRAWAGEVYLHEYDAPGTRILAGFAPKKAELVWGEPIIAVFTIQNVGTGEFKFMFGGDYRGRGRHDRFKIEITDKEGKTLADPKAEGFDMGGMMTSPSIAPGKTFTHEVDLTQFRTIPGLGEYTVQCGYGLEDAPRPGQKNLVISTTFKLKILERTPERVTGVLDELGEQAGKAKGEELVGLLDLMARFGEAEGLARVMEMGHKGEVEQRAAAMRVLGGRPGEGVVESVIAGLSDPEEAVRAAAAGALGTLASPAAVDALLKALPGEKGAAAMAILQALGSSKSEKALVPLVEALDEGNAQAQEAAVAGLANMGTPKALEMLQLHVESANPTVRYWVVRALAERLHQPMKVEWLLPVLMQRGLEQPWMDSLRLMRLYGGEKAVPALLSCLDFDAPWNYRNWWILETGVKPCANAPQFEYVHDPNREGTPAEIEKNAATLAKLKTLAGPVLKLEARAKRVSPPLLEVDPPIDFQVELRHVNGSVEIVSGFLKISMGRNSNSMQYVASPEYRELYQTAYYVRALKKYPDLCDVLEITPEQIEKLGKLPGKDDLASDFRWHQIYVEYLEAPPGLKDELEQDLKDAVREVSQNYHKGIVDCVEGAREILTNDQLKRLPGEVDKKLALERLRIRVR